MQAESGPEQTRNVRKRRGPWRECGTGNETL
jgi:hypothetical protein